MTYRSLRVFFLLFLFYSSSVLAMKGGGKGSAAAGGGTKPAPTANSVGSTANRSGAPSSYGGLTPVGSNVHHADEEGRVQFKAETVLVQIPAVVTDKSGAHVHGLSRDDFQILENGKEQKIASFEEVEAAHTALATAGPHASEFSNLAANGEAPRSITVIALDTVNTPFLDQAYGRKQLIRYLAANVNSDQVLGLVAITSTGLKVLHGLTSDPAVLIQTLKKVSGEIPAMQGTDIDAQALSATADVNAPTDLGRPSLNGDTEAAVDDFILNGDASIARIQQDRAVEVTMRAFLNIAWSLSGIPGRKSLIWATGGFPFYLDSPAAVPAGYLAPLYEQAMQALNDSAVSIYPVDVRGLVNYSPATDVTYAPRGSAATGPSFARSVAARGWLQNSTFDTLRDFAEMTGGRAFYNSNDISGGFRRAADDSSSYYVLGYYLDTKNTKAGWRQVKVKVRKHDTEVRARNGYFVTNATVNPDAARKTDVQQAIASPFDSTGIGMSVRWRAVSPDGDKKKIGFALHLPPEGVTIQQTDKSHYDLDVFFMAMKNGAAADSYGQTIQGTPTAETLAKMKADGLAYNNSLELGPGEYTVRFVVRDNLSGRVGSVSAPLTVN
jgi:VWFA-related protein